MTDSTYAVRFTKAELWELLCLLANGVFDAQDPENKVAAEACDKLRRAHDLARRARLTTTGD